MSTYQLDHQWHKERARLASLEALVDPFTIECLEKIGIQPGWQCLEVGAGGGSMTSWLCKQVGEQGRVVAIDLETKFLQTLQAPNLEIRQQNIVDEALETQTFDLVYSRAVLEHIPAREMVLDKLIQALKPNGWLLVMSGDYISFASANPRTAQLFERGYRAFMHLFEVGGVDLYYGRRLASALRERKIKDVQMRGYVAEWGGDRPVTQTWTYLFERVAERVLAANLLTAEEVDEFLQLVNAPDFTALTITFCSAWGQK